MINFKATQTNSRDISSGAFKAYRTLAIGAPGTQIERRGETWYLLADKHLNDYYRSGDALRFLDTGRPKLGLMFDGRIAEDFKLSSGTFVSVGPMRARVISEGAPYVRDAGVTGIDRDEIGLLVFPRLEKCRRPAALPDSAQVADIVFAKTVWALFSSLLDRLNAHATGGTSQIGRLRLMDVAPSLELGGLLTRIRSTSVRC